MENEKIYNWIKPEFIENGVPEYVFGDFYYPSFKNIFIDAFNKGYDAYDAAESLGDFWYLNWTNEVIDLSWDKLTQSTQEDLVARNFGKTIKLDIPDDELRSDIQRDIHKKTPEGENEPITLIQYPNGLELMEGWHRTMVIMSSVDNGRHPSTWTPIKINAWIGK